jgi:hypothetical protein
MEGDHAPAAEAAHGPSAGNLGGQAGGLKHMVAIGGYKAATLDEPVHLLVVDRNDRHLVGAQQAALDRLGETQPMHDCPELRAVVHRRHRHIVVA